MDITISDQRAQDGSLGEYILLVDGEEAGELTWHMRDDSRVITHTGVRPQHRNRGLAAKLMARAMEDVEAEGLEVVPVCSYAVSYLAADR